MATRTAGTSGDQPRKKTRRKRANNEGTVYQRADGKWCGQVYVLTADGTEKRKTVYGKTADEARAKIEEMKIKSRRGVPAADRAWKVGDYLDYWLQDVARHSIRKRPPTRSTRPWSVSTSSLRWAGRSSTG